MLPVGKAIQPGKPIEMGKMMTKGDKRGLIDHGKPLLTKEDRKGLMMNGKDKELVTGKKTLLTKKDKNFSIL